MKTRNKAYRQRVVNIPMMNVTRRSVALGIHAAISTIINSPSIDSYDNLITRVAALCHAGVRGYGIDASTHALTMIADRFDRTGKVGVSDKEAEILKAAGDRLDADLAGVPVNRLVEAVVVIHQPVSMVAA